MLCHDRRLDTSPTSVRSSGRRMERPSLERDSRRDSAGPIWPDRLGCSRARPTTSGYTTRAGAPCGLSSTWWCMRPLVLAMGPVTDCALRCRVPSAMPMLALSDVLASAASATATSMLFTSSPAPMRPPPPLPPVLMAGGAEDSESWLDSCDPSPLCACLSPRLNNMASDSSAGGAKPALEGAMSAAPAICDSQRGVSSLAATAMPPAPADSFPEVLPAGELLPNPGGRG
mmetsp:Transcript_27452/g.69823  ORF Transcript_27452/g.69823 Transcript_27452/m.69823 type:complete len:230 (+) Transcript_27452:849-1538(+)